MKNIRPPAVAGLFYPANRNELAQQVNKELSQVTLQTVHHPQAIIVPHAGYIYSASIAASVFKCLQGFRTTIKRVLLIGPSHRVAFDGLALSSAEFFHTPLGNIRIDTNGQQQLLSNPGVQVIDQAHENEHSLEVQLPFLQQVLDDFSLIPIVAGNASIELVAKVIDTLWDAKETLVVISSDLSHYHDYQTAQQLDKTTSKAILELNYSAIESRNACGFIAVNGLLFFAKQHHLKASIIDVRNSGDTAGDKKSVVGYGSYLFEEQKHAVQ
jgi:AmmeMemoRadiSam system protein B